MTTTQKWGWRHEETSPVGPCYALYVRETDKTIERWPYANELNRSTAYNHARWACEDMNKADKEALTERG